MADRDIVSSDYSFDSASPPLSTGAELPGKYQGVHFVVQPPAQKAIIEKIYKWFEDRNDIILVYSGTTATGLGAIILEWEEREIDPLFLKILEHDDTVVDYTVYPRDRIYGNEEAG